MPEAHVFVWTNTSGKPVKMTFSKLLRLACSTCGRTIGEHNGT